MNMGMAYRLGRLGHADFYQYLRTLFEKHQLSLTHFPAMRDYLQYILLSEAISGELLLEECTRL